MIIKIKVKPHSGKQNIEKLNKEEYLINLKSEPVGNKANLELLRLLKKKFRKRIRIVKGKTSRNKIIELT